MSAPGYGGGRDLFHDGFATGGTGQWSALAPWVGKAPGGVELSWAPGGLGLKWRLPAPARGEGEDLGATAEGASDGKILAVECGVAIGMLVVGIADVEREPG